MIFSSQDTCFLNNGLFWFKPLFQFYESWAKMLSALSPYKTAMLSFSENIPIVG